MKLVPTTFLSLLLGMAALCPAWAQPATKAKAPAQPTEPTETHALITVHVQDFQQHKKPNELVVLYGEASKKKFKGVTDDNGKLNILLPEGDTYVIKVQDFGGDSDEHSKLKIPEGEGTITGEVVIQYEMRGSYTLENVYFETGKATLRENSYPALKLLLESMQRKPQLKIEVAGHTDDVGDDDSNMQLSQDRAEAVRQYLLKNGIASARVIARGYGETQPVAANTDAASRQLNRRTEVRILEQ